MSTHPKFVNNNHFTTETFPEVIGFCDREPTTHIQSPSEESYDYMLNGKTIYTLKKYSSQWELMETNNNKIIRVSTAKSLGLTLIQGLRFSDSDKGRQDERVNILLPVSKEDAEKTISFMYYYGGYPANFLEMSPELALIIERFVEPDLTFFSYPYVHIAYLGWLREELKKADILKDGANKSLWVYKK